MDRIGYIILAIYIAITFRAVLMGIDKMAKVIIGNYLAGITCYAFGNLIQQCVNWLNITPDKVFIGLSYSKYANFLSAGQLTFILLIFILLIRIIYRFGRIQVSFGSNVATEKLYFIILIPITVISFIIGPYIALKADGIQVINILENTLAKNFGFLQSFIRNMSFWMFINGLIFIIISSQIKFKISVSTKATKLPDGI